jgi:ribosomal protein S18 acetylase RimI-like enzyme
MANNHALLVVRPAHHHDMPHLSHIINQTDLFPSELLPDMIASFLANPNDGNDRWLTCELNGSVVGFCFAVLEKLTIGTWNMLALAVAPTHQGQGVGSQIIKELESILKQINQRLLIVESSSLPEFLKTCQFYEKNGFIREAKIRDFWALGNDKIVFWKSL